MWCRPQVKGVPFCKLQGSHDPEDRTKYNSSASYSRSGPRDYQHPVPNEPEVMVIPSGTRSVPMIPLGTLGTSMPGGSANAAQVLRLDEDGGNPAKSSLPSRRGSRAGPETMDDGGGSADSAAVSRRGSRAGPETIDGGGRSASSAVVSRCGSRAGPDIKQEECITASSPLLSRPGSSAGPESRHESGSAHVLSGIPNIAPIPENDELALQPGGYADTPGSEAEFREPSKLLTDADDSHTMDASSRPVPSASPEIMAFESDPDLQSFAFHQNSQQDDDAFSFSQVDVDAFDSFSGPDRVSTASAEPWRIGVPDSSQQIETASAELDILASFRRSSTSGPPKIASRSLQDPSIAHPGDTHESGASGLPDPGTQDPSSSLKRIRDLDPDATCGPQTAGDVPGISTSANLLSRSRIMDRMSSADIHTTPHVGVTGRPGTPAGATENRQGTGIDESSVRLASAGVSLVPASPPSAALSSSPGFDIDGEGTPNMATAGAAHVPAARSCSTLSNSDGDRSGSASGAASWSSAPESRPTPGSREGCRPTEAARPDTAAGGSALHPQPQQSRSSSAAERPATAFGQEVLVAWQPQFPLAPGGRNGDSRPGTAVPGGAFQVSPRRSTSGSCTSMSNSSSLRPGSSAGRLSTGGRSSAFSAALLPQQSSAMQLVPRLSLPAASR